MEGRGELGGGALASGVAVGQRCGGSVMVRAMGYEEGVKGEGKEKDKERRNGESVR